MFQNVNDNLVRGVSVRKASDAHQRGDLTNGDVQGRPSHVGRNSGQGDEIDYPATADKPDEADDSTCDDSKC